MSLAALALSSALLGAAAQAPPTRVDLTGCPSELGVSVETALDVELRMVSEDSRRGLADGTLRCALECDATTTTAVVVHGDDRAEQRIESDVPGLARRLAIALAELLDASSAQAAHRPTEQPEEPPDETERDALPEPPDPEPSEPTRIRARIAGGAWLGGEPLVVLGALELGAEIALGPNLAVALGVAGALGGLDVETAGHLDVRLVSGFVSLRVGGTLSQLWLGAGPAVRGGAVSWTGTPGTDGLGAWLGLGAVGVATLGIAGTPLRVGLEAEGGGIAFHSGARQEGEDEDAARIGGAWLELRVAVDFTF